MLWFLYFIIFNNFLWVDDIKSNINPSAILISKQVNLLHFLALQHNIGLGGAVVVALYYMGFPKGKPYCFRNNVAATKKDIAGSPDGFKVNVLIKALL